MFISLSAVALDKYEWYVYNGKAKNFDTHHASYDLTLGKGDKFGIRKVGNAYKLVDLGTPNVAFTLSAKEVASILRAAAPHSGVYKGIKLRSGATVPAKKEAVPAPKERTYVPDESGGLYPEFPMPPKPADIKRLYTYFNKRYFNNGCPDVSKVRFVIAGGKKHSGLATMNWGPNGDKIYSLRISRQAMSHRERIANIVAHEMIHLMHFKRYYEDGLMEYSGASHGPLFAQDMARLNEKGFKVTVKDHDNDAVVMDAEHYALLVRFENDWYLGVFDDKPFQDKLLPLVDKLRQYTMSKETAKHYVYGVTRSSHIFRFSRLTAQQQIPKRKLHGYKHDNEVIQNILSDFKIVKENDLVPEDKTIRKEIARAVNQMATNRDHDLQTFIRSTLANAGPRFELENRNMNSQEMADASLRVVSKAELQYIVDAWTKATDEQIAHNGYLVNWTKKSLLKYGYDGDDAVTHLVYSVYVNHFVGRRTPQQFADFAVKYFGDLITLTNKELHKRIIAKAKTVKTEHIPVSI